MKTDQADEFKGFANRILNRVLANVRIPQQQIDRWCDAIEEELIATYGDKSLIGQFNRQGRKTEVRRLRPQSYVYKIITDDRTTQDGLGPDEFVRWACNALEDGSEPQNKWKGDKT